MSTDEKELLQNKWKKKYPKKFASVNRIFNKVHPGHRIFISTGCGEPQYLVKCFIEYVETHPKAFFDAEILHVWSLGVAPYSDKKFKSNFRHNSFFVGNSTRNAVNTGLADYSPIFLSQVPRLFQTKQIPIDVAFIQVSLPDEHGYMSLGVSVDITKAAAENAKLIIAQVNPQMPRVHGSTFLNMEEIDYILEYDEPILEFDTRVSDVVAEQIGKYVARIVEDRDTIQVGYGAVPNAVVSNLIHKKDLGVHTELISDGLIELMKKGVITNKYKTLNKGKTVAAFCMAHKESYEYMHDNPSIEFRTVDYTNNPVVIARQDNMTAINSALQIDLTGMATAESIGKMFYSGIGGQADFMRGSILAKGGKTILTIPSTANDDEISRIVPFLEEGAGVTLNRGDVHYIVTEYGIAYLHGKNIRERAMDLIAIAHPKFRPWLIKEAKRLGLIYKDQAFIPGKKGEYQEDLESYRTTRRNVEIFFRPVKISDEPILKEFFYSLSDETIYKRFINLRRDMPHERLQEFCVIDQTKEMVILATMSKEKQQKEIVVGLGQYSIDEISHTAEVAFVIQDNYQNLGVGKELLSYLTFLAKKQGLLGFTAEVLDYNKPMLHLFESMGFDIQKRTDAGVCELKMGFRGNK